MTGPSKYQRLAGELRQLIASGQVGPGGRMPSRKELMAEGHGERTVHEALRVLQAEGWIVTSPGAGTFAADPLPARQATDAERIAALEAEVAALRREVDGLKRGRS